MRGYDADMLTSWVTGPVGVEVIAALCVVAIALWVTRAHGVRAALVMAGFSAAALTCIWIAYEVAPIESWRFGSFVRTLAVFAVPGIAGTILAIVRSRRLGQPLRLQGWAFLAMLWIGPSLVVYIPQLTPFSDAGDASFANRLWFGLSSTAVYVLVPVLFALTFRQRIRSYGLSWGTMRQEARYLIWIIPIVAAIVFFISAEESFQQIYPFYDYELGGDGAIAKLLAFEVVYGLSFVALEFFFRGFLVLGGLPVLGVHAVPVMAFAYCLLHLGKPMPECAASLIGGLALGYIALRFRSIAVGVAAHLTMAWGMDGAVVWRSN
jgi:hypothetical protein